ncbi:cysteine--1-D-myo-inosityl 2-amino-2-deoxy-alpha-D-glucopyranoside ligase [Corynebacterium uberis]|uniref:cysteine--1-D-myo-inosityl 2-amino-2-deoxy-alpha-D-glucopyranoside ligase n=1 Tax=Corynebacterium TaxID=1716 RepID=UPI001D0B5751|nr:MULTISPECIES: cysteine--1-D-myo-inosityl 2-amino-2-deoxy-alpha-D-glucopyranoside ligase [Corynebacterium]MCZ9308647.1 cysteine--1-D-myo-inosityl 2-amino-2-deoxy-alpha-D-glucopyranoside ligase [Corynebacterium sp. c6VSa_13]UDL74288.1 cysteine--1-D-myo-inosityl 2-amino-2-deoxy-alpha-D-glucopyranoside ligase [Corynebacterium uberis]UDL76879.1 cysteine--1-D-myo-inosityl 2-amino-2-deoxy-alpha-D-glucopyranoside ligase [Corynebacterium uberis]UDL79092.1 cysteine--1-D-myo-inosityl 2-amino-2-deoxy-al
MHSWPSPMINSAPGTPEPLCLFDTADARIKPVEIPTSGPVGIYVCGITPYDSTHLGHAATYLTFDLISRVLLDNGHQVHYVQNVTDVDDPLFERAARDNVDWRELGTDQINLFRGDMDTLDVIPPQDFVGAMEAVDEIVDMVARLLEVGAAYIVDDPQYPDVYASIDATDHFGYESNYSPAQMAEAFRERGGDPDRPGKRDPLDALIWRAHRDGEPAWPAPWGAGRPGWHIECSAIATQRLGKHFSIQGGGSDLAFPHHEFSAAHAEAALGTARMAGHYVHTGMIGLDGTKMSKSLGNLVFVSHLTRDGHDPSAIRLGVFAGHYRTDRDWSDQVLAAAEARLDQWRSAAAEAAAHGDPRAADTVARLRARLSDDLDTPGALAVLDEWAAQTTQESGESQPDAAASGSTVVADAVSALLGVEVR